MNPNGIDCNFAANGLADMFRNVLTSDIFFTFNCGERVGAHKAILSSRSTVFRAMFYGANPHVGDVQEFLQFFYFAHIQLTTMNIGEVIHLCEMYDMNEAIITSDSFLVENRNIEDVCQILEIGMTYEKFDLIEFCKLGFDNVAADILRTEGFLNSTKRVIQCVLELKHLSCSEVELFEACMSWVRNLSNQNNLTRQMVEQHLGELFYEIRFGSMTTDEFIEVWKKYPDELFTNEEFKEIIMLTKGQIVETRFFTLNLRANLSFLYNENLSLGCDRLDDFEEESRNIGEISVTLFSVSTNMILHDITIGRIYADFDGEEFDSEIPATFEMYPAFEMSIQDIMINYDDLTNIILPAPLLIRADIQGY